MSKKLVVPIIIGLIVALGAGLLVSGDASAAAGGWFRQGWFSRLRTIRQHSMVGLVTEIGADQFTITNLNEEEVVITVDENTRFRSKEDAELSFADLKVGQWVMVAGTVHQEEKLAHLVVTLPEDIDPTLWKSLSGEITAVDADANEFMIQPAEGDEATIKVDEDTRFLGAIDGLADLQVGEKVVVGSMQQEDNTYLAKFVGVTPAGGRKIGEITAVDELASTFSLLGKRSGEEFSFAVDENTRFRILGGDDGGLADLQVGMMAGVFSREGTVGESPVAALVLAAPKDKLPIFEARFAGKVTSIGEGSLTIQTLNGQEITFQITEETHFKSRGGIVQGLEDLEVGMGVMVGAEELEDGSYQAKLIFARQAPQ